MSEMKVIARRADHAVRRGNEHLWRYVFNLDSHMHHRRNEPRLGAESVRMVDELRSVGVARSTLAAITGDDALLGRLQDVAADLEQRRQALGPAVDETSPGTPASAIRPFLIEMLDPFRPVVDPRGVLADVATNDQIKGIADVYLGLTTKVSDINVWRNLPDSTAAALSGAEGAAGRSTQLWHRDLAEDRYVVKVFIYLEDVTEESGPFSYARGTHLLPNDPHQRGLVHDGVNYRATGEELTRSLQEKAEVCVGPAGSIIFADVRGYHRGGLARSRSRLLMQTRYTSNTALRVKMLRAPDEVEPRQWSRHFSYERRRGATGTTGHAGVTGVTGSS
jgi:hypothetical protein